MGATDSAQPGELHQADAAPAPADTVKQRSIGSIIRLAVPSGTAVQPCCANTLPTSEVLVTAPAFCFDQLLHRSERIVLRRVLLDQLTPTRPDPAAVAHQNHLPE